jgi:hypothetical protein
MAHVTGPPDEKEQFGLTLPLFTHFGVDLWVREIGGTCFAAPSIAASASGACRANTRVASPSSHTAGRDTVDSRSCGRGASSAHLVARRTGFA